MNITPPAPKYFNERINIEDISQIKNAETQTEKEVVGYVRSYFNSNPETASDLDQVTYNLISEQIINIYNNCPALLHQNNFSATIRLYGYNIPINVIQKHHSDRREFINADSGEKMTDEEKVAFQNAFTKNHAIETTKNHIYSSIISHIKNSPNLEEFKPSKEEEKVLNLKLDNPDLFIDADLEQRIIDIILKAGKYYSRRLNNELHSTYVTVGNPVKYNPTRHNVPDPDKSANATPDATNGNDPVSSAETTPDAANGSDPVTSDETTPDAANGSDPVTSDGTTPDAANGSDPVTSDGTTSDAANGSDPVTSAETTPDTANGSDPVTSDETTPDTANGSDPVTSDGTTPDAANGSDPVTSDGTTSDAANGS
ncbi:hypothetical protein, partial [Enterobacter ludwigii]|uniref:hypothetical protein n=1 Tax=Enterobacter ludwigii TaxID=299767 RepID=UPI003974B168